MSHSRICIWSHSRWRDAAKKLQETTYIIAMKVSWGQEMRETLKGRNGQQGYLLRGTNCSLLLACKHQPWFRAKSSNCPETPWVHNQPTRRLKIWDALRRPEELLVLACVQGVATKLERIWNQSIIKFSEKSLEEKSNRMKNGTAQT